MFYFLKTRAKIQIIIAMIKITINIPNPIPALKMSPITSQLVNENSITNTINNRSILFCMILIFKISLLKLLQESAIGVIEFLGNVLGFGFGSFFTSKSTSTI